MYIYSMYVCFSDFSLCYNYAVDTLWNKNRWIIYLMCGLKLRMPMADDCEQMNI